MLAETFIHCVTLMQIVVLSVLLQDDAKFDKLCLMNCLLLEVLKLAWPAPSDGCLFEYSKQSPFPLSSLPCHIESLYQF